jgi:hypothetical protein
MHIDRERKLQEPGSAREFYSSDDLARGEVGCCKHCCAVKQLVPPPLHQMACATCSPFALSRPRAFAGARSTGILFRTIRVEGCRLCVKRGDSNFRRSFALPAVKPRLVFGHLKDAKGLEK